MKEALIIINLVVSASFLCLTNWWLYLRIQRERGEQELLDAQEVEAPHFMADLYRHEEMD